MNRRTFLGMGLAGLLESRKSTAAYLEENRFDIATQLGKEDSNAMFFPGLELLQTAQLQLWNPQEKVQEVGIVVRSDQVEGFASYRLQTNQEMTLALDKLGSIEDILVFSNKPIFASVEATDPRQSNFFGIVNPLSGLQSPQIEPMTFGTSDFNYLPSRDLSTIHHIPISKGLEQTLIYTTIVSNPHKEYMRMTATARDASGKVLSVMDNYIQELTVHECAPISMAPNLEEGTLTIETTNRQGTPLASDVILQLRRYYDNTRHATSLTDKNLGTDIVAHMYHKPKGIINDATQLFISHIPHQYGLRVNPIINIQASLTEEYSNKKLVANYAMPMQASTTRRLMLSDFKKLQNVAVLKGEVKDFKYHNAKGHIRLWMPQNNRFSPLGRIGATILSASYSPRDPDYVDTIRYMATAQKI